MKKSNRHQDDYRQNDYRLDDLEITRDIVPNGIKFTLKGRINSITAPELQNTLERAVKDEQTNIILNMMRVVYLSSVGIRVIIKTYKDAAAAGGKFSIEMPSENVKNVLGITTLDKMLITEQTD